MNIAEHADSLSFTSHNSLILHQPFLGVKSREFLTETRLELIELSFKIVGLILLILAAVIASLGEWIFLDQNLSRLVYSCSVALIGLYFFSWGSRGLVSELHIDTSRHEIRLGSRNSNGIFHLEKCFPFDEIISVFIRRSRNSNDLVSLSIRLISEPEPQKIMRGTERSLYPILEFISQQHANFRKSDKPIRTTRTHRLIQSSLVDI